MQLIAYVIALAQDCRGKSVGGAADHGEFVMGPRSGHLLAQPGTATQQ